MIDASLSSLQGGNSFLLPAADLSADEVLATTLRPGVDEAIKGALAEGLARRLGAATTRFDLVTSPISVEPL